MVVHKTPTAVWAEGEDGLPYSWGLLQRQDAAAWSAAHGAMTPSLVRALSEADGRVPVSVFYRAEIPDDILRGLEGATDEQRADARQRLAEHLGSVRNTFREELSASGLQDAEWARYAPIGFGTVSAPDARKLARHEAIDVLAHTPRGKQQLFGGFDPARLDSVAVHRIDTTFNASGNYAYRQTVGIVETWPVDIYEEHEAFQEAQVFYRGGIRKDCMDHFDCFDPFDRCQAGHCVNPHTTGVASVISNSHGGVLRGAARAHIYRPNFHLALCDAGGLTNQYEWLVDSGVTTVNESFGCPQTFGTYPGAAEGVVADLYARLHHITVTKAAGNSGNVNEHEACPVTFNSICVGTAGVINPLPDLELELSCTSSWKNPPVRDLVGNIVAMGDREEPDIVAAGGIHDECATTSLLNLPDVEVAAIDEWVPYVHLGTDGEAAGTSFAAPAVASMVLLMREACQERWPFINSALARVLVRTAGFGLNLADGAYSTPTFPGVADYQDGGGFLLADALGLFCGVGECQECPDVDAGTIDIDLESGGPPPEGEASYGPGEPLPPELEPTSFTGPGVGDGRLYRRLADFGRAAGQRLRFGISWHGCTTNDGGPRDGARATPKVDFDLFLYHEEGPTWVFGSQSIYDTNEGFDLLVPEDGNYQVWLAWPAGSEPCEGSTEGIAWAWAAWN